MKPGEYIIDNEDLDLNSNNKTSEIEVVNVGDRPIQVGSHYHFAETNSYLKFDRKNSYGKRLNIPSGTSIRFEPGQNKKVELVDILGKKKIIGFNSY
ncbi:MAG: urease subunit beta [Pseudomonadota bacterium]|nr:urease subunit beta [Pseudomonadota bacterium]